MIRDAQQHNENATPKDFEIDVLMEALPHYFDEDGNFKMEKFQNMLQEEQVELSRESYELNFLGKSYARLLASLETETVLVPNEEHNNDERNADSENIYITGDNLDALKHLAKSYRGKVKCIYIDPPYNTGSDDFAYNDTFNFKVDDLVEQIDVTEQEAERILDLQGKSSHSAWLTFMLPRLVLARNLLTADGVIFISIDDNEQSNLTLLCDEIFGEESRIGTFVQDKGNSKSDSGNLQKNHEYIICYGRKLAGDSQILSESSNEERKVLEENGRYFYLTDPITTRAAGGVLSRRRNLGFTIYFHPETRDLIPVMDYDQDAAKSRLADESIYTDREDLVSRGYFPVRPPRVREQLGAWTWELETVEEQKDFLYPVPNKSGSYSMKKRVFLEPSDVFDKNGSLYTNKATSVPPKSLIRFSTNAGTTRVNELIGPDMFTHPKSADMIKHLIGLVAGDGDLVLDFFAGSGTTADAVYQLCADEYPNLRFILVQLDEPVDEESTPYDRGLRQIDQVSRLRVDAAADQIKQDTGAEIDYGFKHYTLVTPPQSVIDSLEEFAPDESLFSDDPLEALDFDGTTAQNVLLTTWMIQDGYGLNPEVKKVTLNNYELIISGNSAYAIDGGLTSDDIRVLTQKLEDGEIDITNFVYFHTAIGFERLRELDSALRHLRNRSSVTMTARW